jgi:hypothetical protein
MLIGELFVLGFLNTVLISFLPQTGLIDLDIPLKNIN